MRLIFIHGWGFDALFWDVLGELLPRYEKQCLDLGFFGNKNETISNGQQNILIGHSLGFIHGINIYNDWAGYVAINSFSHFANIGALPRMRKKLLHNPQRTLDDFYKSIQATPSVTQVPNVTNLCNGLDELRDEDITGFVKKPLLVLASTNDPLVPVATSEALAVPNAVIKWHTTGGHILPQSDAVWCAKEITEFLQNNFEQKP